MLNTIDEQRQLSHTYAVELTDVTICLGNKTILRSINLSINHGGM